MIVGIGNDHHGVEIKNAIVKFLNEKGYQVINYGTDSEEMVDYPDIAFEVGEKAAKNVINYGILLCNTGIGMSIACNKVKGVRCAKVSNVYEAEMTRRDNDANVIALSCRNDIEDIKKMIEKFLETEYLSIERYDRRVSKINNYND